MTDNFLYEHVLRIETSYYVCRVWVAEKSDRTLIGTSASNSLQYLELDPSRLMTVLDVIVRLDGVNSVEITSRSTGSGITVHKNWP